MYIAILINSKCPAPISECPTGSVDVYKVKRTDVVGFEFTVRVPRCITDLDQIKVKIKELFEAQDSQSVKIEIE